jgi:HEAT repeat protein
VAAELIGRMGDKAQGLSRQLWDAHRRFRPDKATSVFVETLALVAPHSEESTTAIRSLLTAIGTGQHRTQIQAARALGSFGSGAVSAVPELERAAQSTDRAVRQAALDALQQIHEKPATDSGKNVPPV